MKLHRCTPWGNHRETGNFEWGFPYGEGTDFLQKMKSVHKCRKCLNQAGAYFCTAPSAYRCLLIPVDVCIGAGRSLDCMIQKICIRK